MSGLGQRWSVVLVAILLGVACANTERIPDSATASSPSTDRSEASASVETFDVEAAAALGEGFVVWESNRSGAWRIWTRRLDGSGLRQLSRDEKGRQHCCPHISPDGTRLTYLSLPGGTRGYAEGDVAGRLRLISPDETGERELAAEARTFFENRAAVWRSERELIFIGGDGRTMLLDVDRATDEALVVDPSAEYGWLVNAALTHATRGLPSFSPFNRVRGRVAERTVLGGCQPYFSHDGRWGYWMAGAGGPVHRIDLASREVLPLLRKNDPLMPADRGYLYFPMSSRDGRLLAIGASRGGHDTHTVDYEVFVMEADPRTLEPRSPAVRFSFDRGVDRFPDVFAEPLALGDHRGEAPFLLRLETGDAQEWTWDFGDGTHPVGPSVTYRFEEPGVFRVVATRGEESRIGMVRVVEAAPPRLTRSEVLDGGRRVVAWLDEPVDASRLAVSFESGRGVASWALGAGGRSVVVELERPIDLPDRLVLTELRDRAQQPNRAPELTVDVEPPLWPSDERELAFLWQTADAANLVRDRAGDVDRAPTLEAGGGATLDHAFAMLLAGGTFRADSDTSKLLLSELRRANEVSLEMTLRSNGGGDGRILALGGESRRAIVLSQRSGSLTARFRVRRPREKKWSAPVELFPLVPGRSTHVVVTYRPGQLAAYRDGELVRTTDSMQGDFFHWDRGGLSFGADWSGTVEGVAIYGRVLDAAEVRENASRYGSLLEKRPEVAHAVVEATRTAGSTPPTLDEISPYRQALVVNEYRVERVVSGELGARTLHVAEWAILGGETLGPGHERRTLTLERFSDNPQLEGVVLANDLGAGELFYAVPGS